jgi:hypothetical protein
MKIKRKIAMRMKKKKRVIIGVKNKKIVDINKFLQILK